MPPARIMVAFVAMRFHHAGQATVEYIFILAFAIILSINVINQFTGFFKDAMGNVSHVLSTHLTIGVCPQVCWFDGYNNSHGIGGP